MERQPVRACDQGTEGPHQRQRTARVLLGADERRIQNDLDLGGAVFETFAAMELVRQADWQDDHLTVYHYRDRDRREVDLVIERRDGTIIGIEVKAAASVNASDLRGLKYLRDRLGERFIAGALLYTGPNTVPYGDHLAAVPLSALWTTRQAAGV